VVVILLFHRDLCSGLEGGTGRDYTESSIIDLRRGLEDLFLLRTKDGSGVLIRIQDICSASKEIKKWIFTRPLTLRRQAVGITSSRPWKIGRPNIAWRLLFGGGR
jgi:hypothetical protein